jgi:cytoskeletal protein RodZ
MTMRTLDISQGGLKLEANFELGVGETMDFVILINGTRIRCRGKILAIEDLNHKVQARLRFTRTSSSEQRKLSDYLHSPSVKPSEKRLIGGLFILAGVFLAVMIGYNRYFHSGPNKRVFEENRQLQDDRSARPVSESKMEAETESRKENIRQEKETVVSARPSQAGLTQENDIQKSPKDLTSSQLPGVVSESGAEFQTIQDKPQGSQPSRAQEPESKEVPQTSAKGFAHPSRHHTRAAAASESAPARVTHALIRRSAIALGVENREPIGISQRVSVSQQRVYCWMHVIDGKGEKLTVRWIGKGRRVAEAHLPVGSNSWRTWAYISLKPGMIGPAQVEILGENGEILKTLSFEITE